MSTVERNHVVAPAVVTERDVLHRAADVIEEWGWHQGNYSDTGLDDLSRASAFCAFGAIKRALLDFGRDPNDGFTTYSVPLARLCPDFRVTTWNDAPGRTKTEVVSKLREAAEAYAA